MVATMGEEAAKKGERHTAVAVAVIGLASTVVSAVLPWWLSTSGSVADASPAPAAVESKVTPVSTAWPNLTLGSWTITASKDEAGADFSNSTLKFTSQNPTPQGLQLEGFFEWRCDGLVTGREYFRADLDAATRQIFIQGIYIDSYVSPPTLGIGSFSARLSDDGRELLDGTWGSTPGNLPSIAGGWAARR